MKLVRSSWLFLLLVVVSACNSSSSSGDGPSSPCTGLETCCEASTYPSAEVTDCEGVAKAGVAQDCSELLTSSSGAGFCTSSSSNPDAGGSTKSACALLTICCASFPSSSKGGCDAIANAGVSSDCAEALAGDEMAALCSDICASSSDCSGGQNCDLSTNKCVGCSDDSQCPGPNALCIPSTQTCAPGCGAPNDRCGGTDCVYLQTDPANCGACGKAVGAGQLCVNGAAGCEDGETLCDGACIDTTNDLKNCGKCGHACANEDGAKCSAGKCLLPAGSSEDETCNEICGSGCSGDGFAEYCCDGSGTSCSESLQEPTSLACGDLPDASYMGCPLFFVNCYCE